MNIGIEDLRYIEERVISFKNLIEEKISFINGYLDDIECVEDLEFVNLKKYKYNPVLAEYSAILRC